MERLLEDLRFAARLLLKDRGYTLTAALTLAVCIAANVVMFAIVHAVLLKPLPVPHAEQLVYMYNAYPGAGVEAGRGSSGVTDYYDRLRETDVFQEQALYNATGVTLGGAGEPQRIRAMTSTPSLLRLLQARPLKGRLFEEADGEPYTVIGVLPADFSFLDPEVAVWLPVAFTAAQKSDDARHSNNWSYLARLKPGATVEQARHQVDALNARNLDRFPQLKQILINAGFHTVVVPFQAHLTGDLRSTLFLLWGGAAFVLLIGVVNVTNLMLVRSSSRAKELATRHALGAGFARLARQLLTECLLLTAAASVLGIALAAAAMRTLSAFAWNLTPQGTAVTMDPLVLGVSIAGAFAVGITIGLLPVLSIRHTNLSQAFREDGRTGTAGRGARAVRRVLVATQVAFAFMLLIGASSPKATRRRRANRSSRRIA